MRFIKIFIIMLFLVTFCIFIHPNASQNTKYNIKVKKDDSLLIFILNKNLNALYIKENNITSIVILNYSVNDKQIEKILNENNITNVDKLYNITPVMLKIFDKESKFLTTKNNLISLKVGKDNFCIFNEEQYNIDNNFKDCKFLYMFNFKNDVLKDLIGNPYVIFQNYNNPLPILTQEQIYDDWTELYTIEKDYYTILKVSNKEFNIIVIPIVN